MQISVDDINGCDRLFMERNTAVPAVLGCWRPASQQGLTAVRMTASQHRRDARVPLVASDAA